MTLAQRLTHKSSAVRVQARRTMELHRQLAEELAGMLTKASGGVSVREGNDAKLQKKNRTDAASPATRKRFVTSQIRPTATQPWWVA